MRLTDGRPSYFPLLDGLRAIAVLLVLVHHFGGTLATLFDGGYLGVDVFFVISGFLITTILIADTSEFAAAYGRFVGRRTLRIFPLYYAVVALLVICNLGTARENLWWLVSYTWNYPNWRWDGSGIFYLWSLAVEEQFYLFWPVIALALRRFPRMLLLLSLSLVVLGYGQLIGNWFPSLTPWNYTGLVNRMGSLSLGAAAAILNRRGLPTQSLLRSRAIEVAIASGLVWSQLWTSPWRLPLMGICSTLIVLKAVRDSFQLRAVRALLDSKLVRHVGRVSYGVYLLHIPVELLSNALFFDSIWLSIPFESFGPLSRLRWHSWIVKLPLYSGLTIALASLSYRWFESPLLQLKDRWFPARLAIRQPVWPAHEASIQVPPKSAF